MVTDTEGYVHVIEYLVEHLHLFENISVSDQHSLSVMEVIERELSTQVITVCSQNTELTSNQRNSIIREIDAIMCDLEEILSAVMNNPVNIDQESFLVEWILLIKNLFDSEIHQ